MDTANLGINDTVFNSRNGQILLHPVRHKSVLTLSWLPYILTVFWVPAIVSAGSSSSMRAYRTVVRACLTHRKATAKCVLPVVAPQLLLTALLASSGHVMQM